MLRDKNLFWSLSALAPLTAISSCVYKCNSSAKCQSWTSLQLGVHVTWFDFSRQHEPSLMFTPYVRYSPFPLTSTPWQCGEEEACKPRLLRGINKFNRNLARNENCTTYAVLSSSKFPLFFPLACQTGVTSIAACSQKADTDFAKSHLLASFVCVRLCTKCP